MSNWIYNWLRSKVGEGQVLVRDGHRLVGMSRTEYLGGDNLRPVDDATYDLGDSSHGWRNLFLSGDLAAVVTLASATSDTSARTTFAKDLYAFAAGDVIDVRIRTGTAWSATTVDLAVAVEIEC